MAFFRLHRNRREKKGRCPCSPGHAGKVVCIAFVLLLFLPAGRAVAGEDMRPSWHALQTEHTVIRYRSPEDLKRFNRRIRFSAGNHRLLLFSSSHDRENMKGEIRRKVDAVFERVQQILDMRKSLAKVVIQVYHDSNQLQDAYFAIYRQPCRIRAWYRYWNNTIYINARDLHEGMLAHEMAHAIIDHYMVVRPPRATAEILARYVDQHLEE